MKTRHTIDEPHAVTPRRLLVGVVVAVCLALIFLAYLRPGFALDLMDRFILCL